MSTLHRDGPGVLMLTKGAPESVLPRCIQQLTEQGAETIDSALNDVAGEFAAQGTRVLALAIRRLPSVPPILDTDTIETDLVFVGLVALADPPRVEVAGAVAECQRAGIKVVMITGDHAATARAIARQLGILDAAGKVVSGRDLAKLSSDDLAAEVSQVRVYARISPEQKIRIIDALQDSGEVVAMTGDGINDAPALKRADVGVAMGKIGTDVAREAASIVLLDDNFATIVNAVREGRRIFDNVRKFVRFVLAGNSGEIWTLFLAPFFGLPIPLLPIHILWVNLVTDGLPGLALAAEPAERSIMRRSPRPPRESIFSGGLWQHIVWVGLLIGALSIFTQTWAIQKGVEHWQSMVFTVLTLSQMGNVLAIRSERDSLFRIGLGSNKPLLLAVLLTLALQLAILYVPWLQSVFKTAPLTAPELGFCVIVSSVVFAAVEVEKLLVRRGLLYRRT
jgi:Ca2+-transporting ATPase